MSPARRHNAESLPARGPPGSAGDTLKRRAALAGGTERIVAGDWIKMRVWLRKDPRVASMADFLAADRGFMNWVGDPVQKGCKESVYELITSDITRALVVTSLLEIWGLARDRGDRDGDDLVLKHCDIGNLDAICGTPGIGEAMEFVEWAVQEERLNDKGFEYQIVRFPNWFKENESPDDKYRRQHAEAQGRYRDKIKVKGDKKVTSPGDITMTPREEKRREEVNPISTPIGVDVPGEPGTPAEPVVPGLPACPHQALIALYHEILPLNPRVLDWNETRQGYLRSRWRKAAADGKYSTMAEGMAYWRKYFEFVARSRFLTGDSDGRDGKPPFVADLEWLIRPTNYSKVIEGKYHGGERA